MTTTPVEQHKMEEQHKKDEEHKRKVREENQKKVERMNELAETVGMYLREYKGLEGNIPLSHDYWGKIAEYRGLKNDLENS